MSWIKPKFQMLSDKQKIRVLDVDEVRSPRSIREEGLTEAAEPSQYQEKNTEHDSLDRMTSQNCHLSSISAVIRTNGPTVVWNTYRYQSF